MQQLNSKHAGMFNREIEQPKMFDGSAVSWWTFRDTFRYYEFNGMCVAYDDVLHNLYLYSIQDDENFDQLQTFRRSIMFVDRMPLLRRIRSRSERRFHFGRGTFGCRIQENALNLKKNRTFLEKQLDNIDFYA